MRIGLTDIRDSRGRVIDLWQGTASLVSLWTRVLHVLPLTHTHTLVLHISSVPILFSLTHALPFSHIRYTASIFTHVSCFAACALSFTHSQRLPLYAPAERTITCWPRRCGAPSISLVRAFSVSHPRHSNFCSSSLSPLGLSHSHILLVYVCPPAERTTTCWPRACSAPLAYRRVSSRWDRPSSPRRTGSTTPAGFAP